MWRDLSAEDFYAMDAMVGRAMETDDPEAYIREHGDPFVDVALEYLAVVSKPDDKPFTLKMHELFEQFRRDRQKTQVQGDDNPQERPPIARPNTIGGYQLLEKIGEGGMGLVYLAEQESPRRLVAVKLLNLGGYSARNKMRFLAEAKALGKMRHPGIASIIEAGIQEDVPFIAMEYCDGPSLDYYNTSTLDLKLDLFLQLCDAVTHAHQQGIIHRDLKPSNIMVETVDGKPQVRVIDFGISKPVTLSDDDRITATHAILGTPSYMAPEQITGQIDTRSDVHALGVLLYELITQGTLPYGAESNLQTIERVKQGNPKPPSAHQPDLSRDLDAIVLKALSTQPEDRYDSAAALAADIRAFRNHMPIQARPITSLYMLKCLIARNKIIFTSAAIVSLLTIAFLFSTIYQRNEARKQQKRAETVVEFFVETYGYRDPFEKDKGTIDEAMERATPLVNQRFPDDPYTRAAVHFGLADVYLARGVLDKAEYHSKEVLAASPTREQYVEASLIVAMVARQRQHYKIAESLYDALLQSIHPNERVSLKAQLLRAHVIREQGRYAEAEDLYRALIPSVTDVFGEAHYHTHNAIRGLATTLMYQDKHQEAEARYLRVLDLEKKNFDDNNPRSLETMNSLADLYRRMGEGEKAIEMLKNVLARREEKFGEGHINTLKTRVNLQAAFNQMHHEEAVAFGIKTLALHEKYLGPAHPETMKARNNLAVAYHFSGELNTSVSLHAQNYRLHQEGQPVSTTMFIHQAGNYADALIEQGSYDMAKTVLEPLLFKAIAAYGETHTNTLIIQFLLGVCAIETKDFSEGKARLETACQGLLSHSKRPENLEILFMGYLGYAKCKLGKEHPGLAKAYEQRDPLEERYRDAITRFHQECTSP